MPAIKHIFIFALGIATFFLIPALFNPISLSMAMARAGESISKLLGGSGTSLSVSEWFAIGRVLIAFCVLIFFEIVLRKKNNS